MKRLALAILITASVYAYPGQHGLGASSITCVDRDGDGYGTGPLRIGPFTDLVTNGSNAKIVTSSSYSFVTADVNETIQITGGTGFTAQSYIIDSVSAGAATLHTAPGATSLTGGLWTRRGCLGQDSDDQDYTIHTGAELVAKYGSLTAALSHLGYNPARIWYVGPAGNDTTCLSGSAPVGIGSPCLTPAPMLAHCAVDDALIYRSGNYIDAALFYPRGGCNGTSGHPTIVMAYPGETVIINTSVTTQPAINLIDNSWFTIDGFKLTGADGGCVNGGTSAWFGPIIYTNVIVRHIEAYGCKWGYAAFGFQDILLEDFVGHDDSTLAREHAVYWGSYGAASSNGTIRRSIAYNNGLNGFHINGSVSNLVMEQNISYNNLVANFDFQNGTHDSFFRSNQSFQGGDSGGLIFFVYAGTEGASGCGAMMDQTCVCLPSPNMYAVCAHDQTNNVIENFSHVQGEKKADGTTVNPVALQVARSSVCDMTTPACLAASQGSNTFRNIILTTYNTGIASYPPAPIWYPDAGTGWPQSSTFDSLVVYQTDATHSANVILYGPSTAYTCSSPPSGVTLTNCVNADPTFGASASTWSVTPNLFDLRLQSGSPAIHAGVATGAPTYDVVGNPISATPSMGSLEQIQATWTDLGSGSRLIAAAPQNCNNTMSPAYCDGVIYAYHDNFHGVLSAWGGCVPRIESGSEQLACFGGGHNDYLGNDIHTINLNVSPATTTMVTTPSIPQGSASPVIPGSNIICTSPMLDGRPMSQHSYQNSTYLPAHDELFFWGQGQSDWCLNSWTGTDRLTWTFSFGSVAWTNKAPSGFDVKAGIDGTFGANVVLDSSHGVTADETVLVAWGLGGLGELLRYDRDTNAWAQLLGFGSYSWPSGAVIEVDPVRKLLVFLGTASYLGTGGLKAIAVDISNSSYNITDISSALSGCSAANVAWPGLKYDHTTGNMMVYVGAGSDVLSWNPETGVCITISGTGGPSDPAPTNGEWGKWQYFPTLGKFAAASLVTSNAFTFQVDEAVVAAAGGSGIRGSSSIGGSGAIR